MKKILFFLCPLPFTFLANSQPADCTFKQPAITINFGSGNIAEINSAEPYYYSRVFSSCPTDGHYAYTSYTNDCFRGDWLTLEEDHTLNDASGNMMLVNAARNSGTFLTKTISGLKSSTTYEFAVWMMNVCRISDKCPFPLLPRIDIKLETTEGKTVAQFQTGELARGTAPKWVRYSAVFTIPPSQTTLNLTMIDNAPGGCGNDFALDDITFRECVKQKAIVTTSPKKPPAVKRQPVVPKPVVKREEPKVVTRQPEIGKITTPEKNVTARATPAPVETKNPPVYTSPRPPVLTLRANPTVQTIEAEAGEISVQVYDNGEIDGDTVSIYHNSALVVSHTKLDQKPISFRINVNKSTPHHELIMVAHNLGSIPPNTSVMVVTAGTKRYEVFISSTEKKNAKVVIELKE